MKAPTSIDPLQNGDSDTMVSAPRGSATATRLYRTMPATASRDGRPGVRKALPPWVTKRLWSPSMTFWKMTTAMPKSSSGEPIAAARP